MKHHTFRKSRLGAAVLCAVLGATVPGLAGADTVTLAQAYQRMMADTPEFEILGLEHDVAEELVRQAKGERRPRIGLGFQANQVRQDIISSDNTTYSQGKSDYPTLNVTLSFTQPIYDAGRWRQMGVAEAQRALVEAKAERARNDLVSQMVDKFIDVAQAQFMVQRSQTVIAARTRLVDLLDEQVQAGRADLASSLRAQGEILSAETDESNAQIQLTQSVYELARFAGPEVTAVSLSDNRFGVVDSANLRSQLTRERLLQIAPDIQIAKAELDVAQKSLSQIKAGHLPTADLVAELSTDETDGSLFGGGSHIQTNQVGVAVTIPIYQGGIISSKVREAEKRVEIAQKKIDLATRTVLRQYDALIAAEKKTSTRIAALSAQRDTAGSALQASKQEEASGRVGADVAMEQQLRVDVFGLETQAARLQQLRIQSQLFSLFGAFDVNAVSREMQG